MLPNEVVPRGVQLSASPLELRVTHGFEADDVHPATATLFEQVAPTQLIRQSRQQIARACRLQGARSFALVGHSSNQGPRRNLHRR